MKKLLILPLLTLSALIGCIIFGGCDRHSRTLAPFGWAPIDKEFDSLTIRADRFYEARGPKDSMTAAVEKMKVIGRRHPDNKQMQARLTFWDGLQLFCQQDYDKGYALMEKSLEMTDSAHFPYDWHRIAWTLDMDYHDPDLDRYNHLVAELDFFLKAHDNMIAGGLAMELGCFLNDLGDVDHGTPYLYMADSLFSASGWEDQRINNRINHAGALRIKRDTVAAVALNREILADTVNPVAPYARDIVLGNIYALTEDTLALREAYSLALRNPLDQEAICLYQAFWAQEKLKSGDVDSARIYMNLSMENFRGAERPDIKLEYYRMRSRIFDSMGRTDSAYKYLQIASALSDSINLSNKDIEIHNTMIAADIAKAKLQDDIERRKLTIWQLSITFSLIVILLIVGVAFYRHIQRRKLERMKADIELERSNRKMLAMELVLKEKETFVETISEETARLRVSGEITPSGANRLTSTLKTYVGTSAERDNFMDTFDKIDAAFTDRIRADYPLLTDADIRMAAFIALGLDNKHISRVMGIRPESVKQARWRLRSKLSLPAGASLEDAVRPYLSKPQG